LFLFLWSFLFFLFNFVCLLLIIDIINKVIRYFTFL
jgi:hypothetical protein